MTSPDRKQHAPSSERVRFLVREAPDINRLAVHVIKHWRIPAIDVRIKALPTLDSQRAQDRFVRLSGACNCLLWEVLAGTTFLVGGRMAWVSARGWGSMGLVAVATLGAAFIGKGIEVFWTRARLLIVLRKLRCRLDEAIAGRIVDGPVKVRGSEPTRTHYDVFGREEGEVLHREPTRPRHSSSRSDRPRILVHDIQDMNRLIFHLVTHWKLPHIDIQVHQIPHLISQRAQDRLLRLCAGNNYLLAGILGTAAFLGSFAYIVWPSNRVLMWTMRQDPNDILIALTITLIAALIGFATEILWIRLRLVQVLLDLRHLIREDQRAKR